MKKQLLFRDDKSQKFWRVSVEESTMTVIFGRVGTAGRSESKEFATNDEAENEAIKLIKEKLKKGYTEDQDANFGVSDFWYIIERAKKSSDGDTENQAELVTEILETRPIQDIIDFGSIFNELHRKSYRSDWWGAGYIINGGCSDDGFEYFRAWVISKGKKAYEEALENPESIMKYVNEENIDECEAESLMYAAYNAYKRKSGLDDFFDKIQTHPLPELVMDWKEDDDSLDHMFPKLTKKCNKLQS